MFKITKEDFNEIIVENDDGEFIKHGIIATPVDFFINTFGDVLFSYDELINHKNATPAWKTIFGEWKQQGILN